MSNTPSSSEIDVSYPPQRLAEDNDLARVADELAKARSNVRFFRGGETIFTEGSRSDTAFIIESGLVEIFVGDGQEAVRHWFIKVGGLQSPWN